MTNERASELWSTWVGSQTPAEFATNLVRGGYGVDIGESVHEYVQEVRDSLESIANPRPTDTQAAEAVEAILYLILRPEFRVVLRDLLNPHG